MIQPPGLPVLSLHKTPFSGRFVAKAWHGVRLARVLYIPAQWDMQNRSKVCETSAHTMRPAPRTVGRGLRTVGRGWRVAARAAQDGGRIVRSGPARAPSPHPSKFRAPPRRHRPENATGGKGRRGGKPTRQQQRGGSVSTNRIRGVTLFGGCPHYEGASVFNKGVSST